MSCIISYEELVQINLSLQKENDLLKQQNTELSNCLSELKEYYKKFDKFTATVYAPNKSTYKELEEKVKDLETIKQKEIDKYCY